MLVSHEQEKAKNLILHMIEDYAKKYMIPSINIKMETASIMQVESLMLKK